MKGFKDFILRGNLVELAVAFVMATAFAAVVVATVTMLMDIVGKVGGTDSFSTYTLHGIHVGAWITAIITFVTVAAVVYFAIVIPYQKAREFLDRNKTAEEEAAPLSEDTQLLTEIRDLLAQRSSASGGV
jgi:large conductance mechanosensitive channel